jgi:hypothetical protein
MKVGPDFGAAMTVTMRKRCGKRISILRLSAGSPRVRSFLRLPPDDRFLCEHARRLSKCTGFLAAFDMSGNGSKRRNIRDLFLAGSHALLAVFYAVRQISRFSIVTVKAKGE